MREDKITEKRIEEGNKLIAEFMGGKYLKRPDGFRDDMGYKWKVCPFNQKRREETWYKWDCLEYHSSWAWLMPVVEKIRNIDEDESDTSRDWQIAHELSIYHLTIWADIDTLWNAVCEFIEWYNSQQKTAR